MNSCIRSHIRLNRRDFLVKTRWHLLPQPQSPLDLAGGTLILSWVQATSGLINPSISVCPGRELADASLWIAVALTLATMKIGKPLKPNGKEMQREEVVYSSGAIRWECISTTRLRLASLTGIHS